MSGCNKWPGCGYCKECDNVEQLRRQVEELKQNQCPNLFAGKVHRSIAADYQQMMMDNRRLESQTAALRDALIDCGIALISGENVDKSLKKRQLALQTASGDNRKSCKGCEYNRDTCDVTCTVALGADLNK